MLKYFDVSEHQGAIDWETVVKSEEDAKRLLFVS